MSRPIGEMILEKVAQQYRHHPESWTVNDGPLLRFIKKSKGAPLPPSPPPDKPGCADTMIRYFAAQYGGKPAEQMARNLLYQYHDLEPSRSSIWYCNDVMVGTVDGAIAFVERTRQFTIPKATAIQNIGTVALCFIASGALVALIHAVW